MNAIFYKTASDRDDAYKDLQQIQNKEIQFKAEVSITNPVLTLQDFPIESNYIYIDELKRYYFIDNVSIVRGNLYQITCSIDVLSTYIDQLRDKYFLVNRNEFIRQPYIVDDELVVRTDQDIFILNVGSVGAVSSSFPYFLVTSGGQSND